MEDKAVLKLRLEKFDMKAAAIVAQEAILEEIYLVDGKISRKPLLIPPEALSLEHHCSTQHYYPDGDDVYRLGKRYILCNFRVTAFSENSRKKPIMKIMATFCTSFSSTVLLRGFNLDDDKEEYDEEEDKNLFDYFFHVNPIVTAWPYWREFAQNMSARAGYPSLTIPTLAIVPKNATGKETEVQSDKGISATEKKINA